MWSTGDGLLLPAYIAAWLAVAVLGLWHLRDCRLTWPVSGMVGMMTIWALVWVAGWIAGLHSMGWQTSVTYGGPSLVIACLLWLLAHRPAPAPAVKGGADA